MNTSKLPQPSLKLLYLLELSLLTLQCYLLAPMAQAVAPEGPY